MTYRAVREFWMRLLLTSFLGADALWSHVASVEAVAG
jgi:hypothetical protein